MLTQFLTNPYIRQRLMTVMTNRAPGNIVPPLTIEGSVIVGRTSAEAKRSGFLGMQERVFEEISAAIVWLWGVKSMTAVLKKGIQALQKRALVPPIHIDADWSQRFTKVFLPKGFGKKTPSILLSPLEKFSGSYHVLRQTLGFKAGLFVLSITIPLSLIGFFIPRFNQIKTEWLIKKFYSGVTPIDLPDPALRLPSEIRAQNATPQPQPVWLMPQAFRKAPFNSVYSPQINPWGASAASNPWQTNPTTPWPSYSTTSQNAPNRLRFGWMPGMSAMGVLSQLGHYVNNSTYGPILAMDVGVTGGRMWNGWRRSKYEAFEYFVRDAGSLVFYLYSVPKLMEWSSKGLQYLMKDRAPVVELDQQVITYINRQLMAKLQTHLGTTPVTPEALRQIIHGVSPNGIHTLTKELAPQLKTASTKAFLNTLKTELHAYPLPEPVAQNLLGRAERWILESNPAAKHTLSTEQLESLLQAIWNREGAFADLPGHAGQFHLNTAAKHAFQHEAGLTRTDLSTALNKAIGTLPHSVSQAEQTLMHANLNKAATLGSDKVAASMLRRSFVVAQQSGLARPDALEGVNRIVQLAERATLENIPMTDFVRQHLSNVITEYQAFSLDAKKPASAVLQKSISTLERSLQADQLSAETYKILSNLPLLLRQNGRSGWKLFRWMQGPGLGNLADEIQTVLPLLKGQTTFTHCLNNHTLQAMEQLLDVIPPSEVSARNLLKIYASRLPDLYAHGRVTLLHTQTAPNYATAVQQELGSILQNGLLHDDAMLSKSLKMLQKMPNQIESYVHPEDKAEMLKTIRPYFDRVEFEFQRLISHQGKSSMSLSQLNKSILKPLFHTNGWWRHGIWAVSLGLSMVGIGWFIPKAQYWMTRVLTGSSDNPGLVAITERLNANAPAVHRFHNGIKTVSMIALTGFR